VIAEVSVERLPLDVWSSPEVNVRNELIVIGPPERVTPFELLTVTPASVREPGISRPDVRGPLSCWYSTRTPPVPALNAGATS